MIAPGKMHSPSARFLIIEALKQGYKVIPQEEFAEFNRAAFRILDPKKNRDMLVTKNNHYPDLSHHAKFITKHKYLTHELFIKHRYPTPKTHCFHSLKELLELWKKEFQKGKIVLKPENKGLGKDVFLESQEKKILAAGKKILAGSKKKRGLIQEHRAGKDLRLQVIGGQLFAACSRIPAHITGNGVDNISDLITLKNKAKSLVSEKSVIVVDDKTMDLLEEQGLNLDSIAKNGKIVQLKKVSTVGLGGDPIDVTGRVHPTYSQLAEELSKLFNVKNFAIDLIVLDEGKPLKAKTGSIIEINAPCMWYIHQLASGQKRNSALAILDAYFHPESFNPKNQKYLIS